jgi:hypothetical protein
MVVGKVTFKKNLCRAPTQNARQRYIFVVRLAETHDKLRVIAVRFL